MSKKFVAFVLAMFALVIVSGGCGGGSSSSLAPGTEDTPIDNPEDNPYGVVLEDILLPDAEVAMEVAWNNEIYELKFRNMGNGEIGDFELLNSSSDLPFKASMGYGISGVSAMFSDLEFDDMYFAFILDVQKRTYYIDFSDVLACIWARNDDVHTLKVNGVEFLNSLQYESEEFESFPRYTLSDVFEENGVFSINFTMEEKFYHYTWRKVRDSLDYRSIDDYQENDLSVAEMVISREGFDTVFVNDNNGKWVIVSFNLENSSYRIKSNTEDIEVNAFYVNGEELSERVTLESVTQANVLGDVLLKGSTVKCVAEINGEVVELGFVNRGDGTFVCLLNTTSAEVSLKRVGRNLLSTIDVNEGFFYVDFSLVEDTYTAFSSSSDYRFKSIVFNEVDVTSRLTEDPLEIE